MVGLLADSYRKAGGRRRIVERNKRGDRTLLEFKTYGPKAFAGIKEIDPDLLDRCIRVPTLKASRPYPDFFGSEPDWLNVRDLLYRWTLQRYFTATDAYNAIAPTGTRRGELWRALESIAVALSLDPPILSEAKTAFDVGTEGTRYRPEDDELELFEYLKEEAKPKAVPFVIEMPKMTDAMLLKIDGINKKNPLTTNQETLEKQEPRRAKWIGETIKKFSLGTQLPRKGRDKVRRYEFNPAWIKDVHSRYANN